jgi:hypothetical protein
MYTSNLMELIGKEVEVMSDGMLYRGRLIEVSETEVFLQGDSMDTDLWLRKLPR